MVVYFDTSAFVPLLVEEGRASESCKEIWEGSSAVASSRLLQVESVAAISRRNRSDARRGGLTIRQRRLLESLWVELATIEVDSGVVSQASEYASEFGLRGFDAVHCAAAASIRGHEVVAASSDRKLLAAWSELGLATFDPLR